MADDNDLKMENSMTAGDSEKKDVQPTKEGSNEDGAKQNVTNEQQEKDIESIKKKATQLLLKGKRNIIIHDFESAVSDLAESCQLFKSIYGEDADEMGDAYLYYGKALFQLARNESDVLGNQVQEDKDDDDDDDDEEEEEEDEEGDREMECEEENRENNSGENGEEGNSGENKQENNTGENSVEDTEETTQENQPSGNETNAEEPEEVNDLQLSWEYLELAKLIYQRNADRCKDTAVKLSEAYLVLGENGLESGNYQTAIDDMKQALEIQLRVVPDDDRLIAETYYYLGVAHSLDTKLDEAIAYFKLAINQLEKKITSLEEKKKANERSEEEERDAFYTLDGEVSSIRSLIKEIEDKISDMNDYRNQLKAKEFEVVTTNSQEGASTSNGTGSSTSSVPVSDISHLVRKKRKNENGEDNSAKKPRPDNGI